MSKNITKQAEIAVLIPCYNEAQTISKVVKDFKDALPEAKIYVYDNNSTDNTYALAKKAGAIVKKEIHQGKGHVVRSMLSDIEADAYVLVDGDDTYPADEAKKLLKPILNGEADMTVGDRLSSTYFSENKKIFNSIGNRLVRALINQLFNANVKDIMTGYRVFSRHFAKVLPLVSNGFEIETEMTAFALEHEFKIIEIPVEYRDRPKGSFSKLNTFKDGYKVLKTILNLFIEYRPFAFFICLDIGIILATLITKNILVFFFCLLICLGIMLHFINRKTKLQYQLFLKGIK